MADIVKVKQDGVQIYPQTHAKAVVGLDTVKGDKGDKGDTGATGPAGQNATTTAVATSTANGLMSKEDKVKLDGLNNITFEKVGIV